MLWGPLDYISTIRAQAINHFPQCWTLKNTKVPANVPVMKMCHLSVGFHNVLHFPLKTSIVLQTDPPILLVVMLSPDRLLIKVLVSVKRVVLVYAGLKTTQKGHASGSRQGKSHGS